MENYEIWAFVAWNKQAESTSYSNLCFSSSKNYLIKPITTDWLRFNYLCNRVSVDEDLTIFCTTLPYNEPPDSIAQEHIANYTRKINDYIDVVSFMVVNPKGLKMLEVGTRAESCKTGCDITFLLPDLALCRDLAYSYHKRMRTKKKSINTPKIYLFLKKVAQKFKTISGNNVKIFNH